MLTEIFPVGFSRYRTLPVLASLMDRYAHWLHEQQYTWRSARYELRIAAQIAEYLQGQSVHHLEELNQQHLETCYQWFRDKSPAEAGAVLVLLRFLRESGQIRETASIPSFSRADAYVHAFMAHLRDVCGYVPSTVRRQGQIAAEFLAWLRWEDEPHRLSALTISELEGFIQHLSQRMGRVALQKPIAILRNLLRFLAVHGAVPAGLEQMIERPRVYRQEQLPRSLPWSTVQVFLASIDRRTALGKRDYAMFSLMITYGLRACDVIALRLDDIQWRSGRLLLHQSKTGRSLELPLTDEVGSALHDYLKSVPYRGAYRQVFLRLKAPAGVLKPTAVIEAFQSWSGRSGLAIPFQGVHCLRHSYALHLLRQGVPVKTIGDLLGHRSPESTAVYLRLAFEDLRTVALPVPARGAVKEEER